MASKRGFAAMSLTKRREIAAMGGRASHGSRGKSRSVGKIRSARGGSVRITKTTRMSRGDSW